MTRRKGTTVRVREVDDGERCPHSIRPGVRARHCSQCSVTSPIARIGFHPTVNVAELDIESAAVERSIGQLRGDGDA